VKAREDELARCELKERVVSVDFYRQHCFFSPYQICIYCIGNFFRG